MSIKNKIVCFSPHPDDELLGCGGSIIKAIEKGADVHICYMSYGETGSPKHNFEDLGKIRKNEALKVCNFIGIPTKNIHFLKIPDNQIEASDFGNFTHIMKIVREVKPNIVYLPHINEQSHDHEQAHKLVMRLDMAASNNFFEFGKSAWWVETVLAYEVWTPMEKYQYSEDISKYLDKKIEALKMYESQTKEQGNVSDFISNKAKCLPGYRAAMTIGEYREMFQVLRMPTLYE
ncbi:MAG: PIG-L family deacetylase [Parcubacteria group bacterium]|nr:PIG-L family deacetylase [Parcubacteria group bacterium]